MKLKKSEVLREGRISGLKKAYRLIQSIMNESNNDKEVNDLSEEEIGDLWSEMIDFSYDIENIVEKIFKKAGVFYDDDIGHLRVSNEEILFNEGASLTIKKLDGKNKLSNYFIEDADYDLDNDVLTLDLYENLYLYRTSTLQYSTQLKMFNFSKNFLNRTENEERGHRVVSFHDVHAVYNERKIVLDSVVISL